MLSQLLEPDYSTIRLFAVCNGSERQQVLATGVNCGHRREKTKVCHWFDGFSLWMLCLVSVST